ncbi:MgtC/SapB family protein [Sphingomonas sp. GCM10030256]|uniref:MgtC/SapB family protein n=1 Tax=Sphingomonas sp. GCM10030256 TaxID=3273427 RepID=UPI00361CAFE5
MTGDGAANVLLLGASLACGLMIGVERGWRLRDEAPGSRVAGVRTYTLLGGGGGIVAIAGTTLGTAVSAALSFTITAGLAVAYWRDPAARDATSFVAAILAFALGLLAGAGQPQLAVAGAAVATLILATRQQSHGFIARMNDRDVHAFARYAVIAGAILPFLPNRSMGPLGAWNPFQLWLVVVLVTGFSFAGYIANRTMGARRGVLATALIGGAYSSTAVTASLSQRLGKGEAGPFTAGILLASAVMYLRVLILVAILSPSTLPHLTVIVGPAVLGAILVAAWAWLRAPRPAEDGADVPGNPVELLPAFGFVAIVALAAVATRWAQARFGESGVATSLFLTGSFDVDAAIVTLSGLPEAAIDRRLAAIALAGTIVANMAVKILVTALYARRTGVGALAGLTVSALVLMATIGWRALFE